MTTKQSKLIYFLGVTLLALLIAQTSQAQLFINLEKKDGYFPLVSAGKSVSLFADQADHPGVIRAARDLQQDINRVTDIQPSLLFTQPAEKEIVIIGTIGKSTLIDNLIASKKLDVSNVKDQWEASLIQTVEKPFPNVDRAIVIAGSDKRGTIYGIYEVSKQIGVSPWYWWADAPPKKSKNLFMKPGRYALGEPAVKYRGIFLNDEAPALSGWTKEKFGGMNHEFYEKVFELILRLKGNYLWPAMWGNAFNDDDKMNNVLADEYGVVMGTSHHEPMLRAQQEWKRYGKGEWNYEHNDTTLNAFWRKGIENMGAHESIVTIAMRGDGDEPMTRGTATALLERIVKKQREIIEDVTKKPASQTPQLWALYKEVQDYYDKGMRVPDDVTLLLCDDNWGNIRKLPQVGEAKRAGGYGIYYHFDYVGGPRNYKWLNTNPIERVWEQMHMAYEHGVDKIWIVNVGDLKPMEFPISFFLDYAWNPKAIQTNQLQAYTEQWCAQQFGAVYAKEIAPLISQYLKYSGRIKPELLNDRTYSLTNYNEFERVVKEYQELTARATALSKKLDVSQQEAYYQLVLHPIVASSNLYDMYYHVALNKQALSNNDIQANRYADKVKELYKKDSLITVDFHQRNNGKWNHMMDQTHIGYTYWQQPPVNKMPAVSYVTAGASVTPVAAQPSRDAKLLIPKNQTGNVFFEKDGYVSMEAEHTTKLFNTKEVNWQVLPNHGRTGSAITTFPVTASPQTLSSSSPHIDYEFYSYSAGDATLQLFFSPSLNFHATTTGLQYAISIDDESPQVISLNADDNQNRTWEKWVANATILKTTSHKVINPGKHTVKFWMMNSGVVLQKLVIDLGGLKPSYLGPPETKFEKSVK